jgi:hypothetical protein
MDFREFWRRPACPPGYGSNESVDGRLHLCQWEAMNRALWRQQRALQDSADQDAAFRHWLMIASEYAPPSSESF